MNTENESKLKLISVRQIQQTLKAADYNIKVDGKFGPETDLALTKYITKQKD
jgi:peptidoglycan hydrolase-like protein with peptidoglycan-binding domain